MTKSTSIAIGLLLCAATAGAQRATGRYGPAKTSTAATRGVQREPAQAPVVVIVQRPRNSNVLPTPHRCAAIVVTPGRVLGANGQVLSQSVSHLQPAPQLQPVPQPQPVPRLQSAPGMQPVPNQFVNQRQLNRATPGSCVSRDASGRVLLPQ